MTAFLTGFLSAALGCLVHAALLRVLPRSWRMLLLPAIILVFLAIFVLLPFFAPPSLESLFVGSVLAMSMGLCYALVLNGVLHDSPTLALYNRIREYGPEGMPEEDFDKVVASLPFVQSRLDALIASGGMLEEDGTLHVVESADFVVEAGEAYRRLRGDYHTEAG